MTFFKNTEFRKVLSFFIVCTLLTAGLVLFGTSAVNTSYNEDLQVSGYAAATNLRYTGSAVKSDHYVNCLNYNEDEETSCTASYKMELKEVVQTRAGEQEHRVAGNDDTRVGTAVSAADRNANNGVGEFFHSTTLSAAVMLRDQRNYKMYAYTRLEASNGDGFTQWDATEERRF